VNKRMIQMLAIVILVIATLGFVKYRQISAAIAGGKSYQPPPEAVTTVVAERSTWATTIDAVGTIAPVQGVTLSADLPGVVDRIGFVSGAHVQQGQVLFTLDSRAERAQLAAAEAGRDLARVTLERSKKLISQNAIPQSEFDTSQAQFRQADAAVQEIQASIDRKTVRAPFAGVTGIRQVNLGQYVHSGDPVVPLQSLNALYVNFSVPQQSVAALHVGSVVNATLEGVEGAPLQGRVTAVDPIVDESTRNVRVQATFPNWQGRLRPGMFVTVQVVLGAENAVVALPSSAINYAPYGNSIYIVETMKTPDGKPYKGVRQQFVKLGRTQGDQVSVVDGVEPGQEIVTSGVFKLRPGAAVTVNNKVQPSNKPLPRPENS